MKKNQLLVEVRKTPYGVNFQTWGVFLCLGSKRYELEGTFDPKKEATKEQKRLTKFLKPVNKVLQKE